MAAEAEVEDLAVVLAVVLAAVPAEIDRCSSQLVVTPITFNNSTVIIIEHKMSSSHYYFHKEMSIQLCNMILDGPD